MISYKKLASLCDEKPRVEVGIDTGIVSIYGKINGISFSAQYDAENVGVYAFNIATGDMEEAIELIRRTK